MPPRVLMVDDNPGDCQLVEEAFRDCRIPVCFHAAADAPAAFATLDDLRRTGTRPDLVIIDLQLPGSMDGEQAIASLRADPRTRHLPIVVFSGQLRPGAPALDAQETVAKPRSYQEYLALVRRLRAYWSGKDASHPGSRRQAPAEAERREAHRKAQANRAP